MAIQTHREIIIDKFFSVPPGVVDVRHANEADGEFNYSSATDVAETPTLSSPGVQIPMTMSSFSITDQTIRMTSDGRSVVDVTFEFPDLPGVININIRETKL
jgi:hypothetical protein